MEETQEPATTTTNGVEEPMKRRISKLSGQRRDALAQVADLEALNATLEKRVATAEALAGRVAELEQQITRQSTTHTQGMALVDAGVTDGEARDYLQHRFGKLGDDAPPFGEWLTAQRESATGFLAEVFNRSPAPEAAPPAEEPTAPTGRPAPSINRGTRATPTGPDGLSVEAILDPSRSFADIKAAMGLGVDPRHRKG